MAFRKLTAKKYNGIYEYYNEAKGKNTIALYISYWVADSTHKKGGTAKRERVTGKNQKVFKKEDHEKALVILNDRKAEQFKRSEEKRELEEIGHGAVLTIDQVATEYFQERKKTGNIEKDMKRYVRHIGNSIYKTATINTGKGYRIISDTKTYEAWIRGRGMTTKKYQRAEDDTSMSVGEVIIKDLDPNVLMRLITALERKSLSAKTVATIMNLFKAITNHAISEGYIVRNPFLYKKAKVEVPKEDRKRLFTADERKAIFIQTRYDITKLNKDGEQVKQRGKKVNLYTGDKRVFMLFKLLYFTGQRPKSIIGLRVKDVDLKQRQISIDSIKEQSGTFVPISDKLAPLLRLWIKDQDQNTRLFDIEYETFQMKTQRVFAKYNKGLDYKADRYRWASMYSFRHTSATVMLAKTGNIKTVQTVLNHSDPKVTAIYAKLLQDAKMEGVNVL